MALIHAKNDPSTHSIQDMSSELHAAANQAGRTVRGLYNSASGEVCHATDKVTTEIRSNPIRSSVIALAVGVFFGVLFQSISGGRK